MVKYRGNKAKKQGNHTGIWDHICYGKLEDSSVGPC